MGDIMYFVKTMMKDRYKMNHYFFDFVSAVKLWKKINLKEAKSIILSQEIYNGSKWIKCYGTEDVDMLDLLIDNKISI